MEWMASSYGPCNPGTFLYRKGKNKKQNGLPLTQLSRHPNYDHCIADWRQRIGQKKEVANGNKA